LTANHLSVYLERADIENLQNYLDLIMGKRGFHSHAIESMICNGTLED